MQFGFRMKMELYEISTYYSVFYPAFDVLRKTKFSIASASLYALSSFDVNKHFILVAQETTGRKRRTNQIQ